MLAISFSRLFTFFGGFLQDILKDILPGEGTMWRVKYEAGALVREESSD